MEKDKQTKVYLTGGGEPHAWPVYPVKTHYDATIKGDKAREILERADFHCVNSEVFERRMDGRPGFGKQLEKKWGVYPTKGERFEIDRMKIGDNDEYRKLAEILEKRAKKKGLTILVS